MALENKKNQQIRNKIIHELKNLNDLNFDINETLGWQQGNSETKTTQEPQLFQKVRLQ